MAKLVTGRIWTCAHCKANSAWRNGWNWLLSGPVETLDSFTAFCSHECRSEKEPRK